MTLRSFHDLEAICRHLTLLHAKLYRPRVNSSRVTSYVYRLFTQGGYPGWVTNGVSFTLEIDYVHYSDSFEVLQAKINCLLSVGPVRPVPRALNKHYSARGGPINVSFMYIP